MSDWRGVSRVVDGLTPQIGSTGRIGWYGVWRFDRLCKLRFDLLNVSHKGGAERLVAFVNAADPHAIAQFQVRVGDHLFGARQNPA